MPFTSHAGQRIHYTIEGTGPLVVLQHGLLLDADSWRRSGIVDAISDAYRVACVDSLGHGRSDKPSDHARYAQKQRAGDVVAVLDELGCERAHLIGHSMGGWIAVGVAKHYRNRLASLVIGGWHPTTGLPMGPNGSIRFNAFMMFARRTAPALTEWVTPAAEPGLQACFEALGELDQAEETLLGLTVPVMLWDGRDDPHHDSKRAFALAKGFQFLSTAGDHNGVLFRHGAESGQGLRAFLDRT